MLPEESSKGEGGRRIGKKPGNGAGIESGGGGGNPGAPVWAVEDVRLVLEGRPR